MGKRLGKVSCDMAAPREMIQRGSQPEHCMKSACALPLVVVAVGLR